jgi:serine/threonine kinase 32
MFQNLTFHLVPVVYHFSHFFLSFFLLALLQKSYKKVCLVERKESKKVYAMKYVNKEACLKQRAVNECLAEVEMLRTVDHPFVVSLWFTFQV